MTREVLLVPFCRRVSDLLRLRKPRCGRWEHVFLRLTLLSCMLIPAGMAHAQESSFPVSGVMRDPGGQPMPGVTIHIKGTQTGTTSSGDGTFTITVPDGESVLVFSFLGFETVEMPVGERRYFDVTLNEMSTEITELVVVGYATQKKASITGAISTANTKDLIKSTSPSLANALAGHVSGLSSTQTSGQPGVDDATLYLRGAGTTNTTSPLILIDGVPRDNIRTIDPNEVESISVLKDASATAVFGVRGANGVIMITTKRGEKGKTRLSINATQSFSTFTREPSRLHSVDYLNLRNEALYNDGYRGDDLISKELIDRYANPLKGLNPGDPDYEAKAKALRYMYPDHDYYREMIRRYAPQTTINANMSGGTDRLGYFLNTGYVHQGGNLKTEPKSQLGYNPATRMNRLSFRANLDYKIAPSMKMFLNVGTYFEKVNMPASWSYNNNTTEMMRGVFNLINAMIPTVRGPMTLEGFGAEPGQMVIPTDINGAASASQSPYELVNRYGFTENFKSNLNSTLGIEWDLSKTVTEGLTIKGMVSYDSFSRTVTAGHTRGKQWRAVPDGEDSFHFAPHKTDEVRLSINKYARTQYKIDAQASLNYNRSFGRHDVTGMFLGQREYWENEGGDNLGSMPYNVLGIAFRATYSFDDRYFVEVNMGYNGSEQFSPKKRFGFFPAVSAGWAISNEKFLKDSKWLTFLKVRASYGKVGNDKMGSQRFLYLDNITMAGGYLPSLGLGQTVREGLQGNADVTWETAKKLNVGLDFRIFKDLSGSVDIFHEDRSDILQERGTVPTFLGVSQSNIPKMNIGQIENKGMEIELSYNREVVKGLFLSLRGNLGFNRNKRTFADEVPYDKTYAYRYRKTGYPIGQHFGYEIDWDRGGYWTRELLDNTDLTYTFGTPRPGDFIYKDLNGDKQISEADMAPIGYGTVPRRTFGVTFGVDWKGFDLTVFFQGTGGYHGLYGGNVVYEYMHWGTYFDYHRNAWTPERWANGEKITYPALSTQQTTNHIQNTFFIQNRSFVRLKNLELGYTFPAKVFRRVGITRLRLFVSGQNLYTWDKLRTDHLDPEPNGSMTYPVTRMFNVGAHLTF